MEQARGSPKLALIKSTTQFHQLLSTRRHIGAPVPFYELGYDGVCFHWDKAWSSI